MADLHVSLCQEKTQFSGRALQRSAQNAYARTRSSHTCLSAWFLPSQNRTSIRCLRPCGPSQKIEFVFSASPETIRREPQEFYFHRSVGDRQDLAVCALWNPVAFFSRRRRFRPPRCCDLLQARSPVLADRRRAAKPPFCVLPQASLG